MSKLGLILLVSTSACMVNESGNWSAGSSGDTSHPVERRSPVEELQAACGAGEMNETGTAVRRRPYLQQVSSDAAIVGLTTTTQISTKIAVSRPDGTSIESADVAPEDLLRSAGETQLWSNVSELQPSTIYCYQLTTDTGALNGRAGFKTAPAANSTDTVRFLAFGDSGGGGSDQWELKKQMLTVQYDLIVHTGDVAYEDGTLAQYQANVFDVYEDMFRSIPFFPAAGNHDYHTASAAPFRDVFNLPGTSGEKWYSYDYGTVHFVALDTEADYKTQVEWLDNDLSGTDLPWKVVYMHRPPYSSGEHGSDTGLRDLLAPVLKRHNVQLVLAGHDHDYERVVPQDGTTFVVTGGGGRGTYSVGTSSWTAFSEDVIHFVTGEVGPEEMTLHAIDATGREFDSVVIPRT